MCSTLYFAIGRGTPLRGGLIHGLWTSGYRGECAPRYFCPYSPECVEYKFCELRQEFITDSSGLGRVSVGWVLTFSEQLLLHSRSARWLPRDPPFAPLLHLSA
jgi:hypothetical protein